MKNIWANLSVTKKLYVVVGIMGSLIAAELLTLLFAMNTLSTLRALVGGEGTWSKGQKNAIHNLHLYIYTKDEQYYSEFLQSLRVNLGDRQARLELMKPEPDLQVAFEGFVAGGVHKSDIPGAIRLIRRFHSNDHLGRALQAWGDADKKIDVLIVNAKKIRELILTDREKSPEMRQLIADTHQLDKELTVLENVFSDSLGEGSRWLERILIITLFIAVLIVEGIGLTLTILFNRNLSRSLKEINQAALDLVSGKILSKIPIRSNDELGQIAGTLNKMIQDLKANVGQRVRAENANQIKTLFVANVTHEVRTPLGIIVGFAEILKDPNLSWEERLRYTQIIENTGQNLTQIINDILDITKVESGHLQIQKSNIRVEEALEDVRSLMSLKAGSNGNTLEIIRAEEIPSEIFTDGHRLQQILINLVNNAIKFTQNGAIKVRYGTLGEKIYFDVEDSGIGIPEASKHLLFQYFSQVSNSNTPKREGTGLGLVFSKKIAQALGGDVELLRSQEGEGSLFRLTIEYTPPKDLASATLSLSPQPPSENKLKGKKILVVDDSTDNQLLLNFYLKKVEMLVDYANNGEIAIQKALNNNYDIVLMDMQMPVMDGYTATANLRLAGFSKPIIALTANAITEERNRYLEVGCNEYLTKPISANHLYLSISKHII